MGLRNSLSGIKNIMDREMEIKKICVVGLGYVGLPLAIRFSKFFDVIGFDISEKRISQLKKCKDYSGEISEKELNDSKILFTSNPKEVKNADFVIVCVPTPVDKFKKPDLSYLKSTSIIVGKNLKKSAIVVYESTVYPGVTEEVCGAYFREAFKAKTGKRI